MLSPKCARPLKTNTTLHLIIGFSNIPHKEGDRQPYALLLGDQVMVGADGAAVMTSDVSKELVDVSFFFKVI